MTSTFTVGNGWPPSCCLWVLIGLFPMLPWLPWSGSLADTGGWISLSFPDCDPYLNCLPYLLSHGSYRDPFSHPLNLLSLSSAQEGGEEARCWGWKRPKSQHLSSGQWRGQTHTGARLSVF